MWLVKYWVLMMMQSSYCREQCSITFIFGLEPYGISLVHVCWLCGVKNITPTQLLPFHQLVMCKLVLSKFIIKWAASNSLKHNRIYNERIFLLLWNKSFYGLMHGHLASSSLYSAITRAISCVKKNSNFSLHSSRLCLYQLLPL